MRRLLTHWHGFIIEWRSDDQNAEEWDQMAKRLLVSYELAVQKIIQCPNNTANALILAS